MLKVISNAVVQYRSAYDDFGELDPDLSNAAYQLAESTGIHVLSGRDPHVIAMIGSQVVGALFISIIDNSFSFDVAVAPVYRRQGIGSELSKIAIQEYRNFKTDIPDLQLNVDVVNPQMQRILSNQGLHVVQQIAGDRVIMSDE